MAIEQGAADIAASTLLSGLPILKRFIVPFFIFLGLIIGGIVIWVWAMIRKSKGKWNVTFRIRTENKETGKIFIDAQEIQAKRITVKGNRFLLLKAELLGCRLFPLLNHHTRPGVYDLLITADNRIFIIDGIKGIADDRRNLKVGLKYPGIDYSLQEINKEYAELNKIQNKSDLLGIVKAASIAIIAICLLIAFIVGMKYWIEAKEIDSQISASEIKLFESIQVSMRTQDQQTNAMILLTDKLKDLVGTNNLRSRINVSNPS